MTSKLYTRWICKAYDALTLQELYAIMILRQEVFIVEQNCPYLDADDKDQYGQHLMGFQNDSLVAYARLLPIGVSYPDYISIGRVVTAPSVRRMGIGKALMEQSIQAMYHLYGKTPIKISAQTYLLEFYQGFGFETVGESYLEDDIPHIAMIRV